jgi:parallel beta-helix repeat protein
MEAQPNIKKLPLIEMYLFSKNRSIEPITVLLLPVLIMSLVLVTGCGGGGDSSSSEPEAEVVTYYVDKDGDGYGDPEIGCDLLSQPAGHVTDNSDCDDNDDTVYPGVEEILDDGKDNDCDGFYLRTYYIDKDGDRFGDPDGPAIISLSQPSGYAFNNKDCNDNDAEINPGVSELCGDGIDNDCDDKIDGLCIIYVPEDYDTINAALDAVTSDGAEIIVNDGTYYENIEFNNTHNNITLRSVNGAARTVISKGWDSDSVVTFKGSGDKNFVLDGFTITNGQSSYGGGIYVSSADGTTISNCTITGNKATYGGGICVASADGTTISNCTIAGNEASRAGGIYIGRADGTTISNCIIAGNEAGSAGGIEVSSDDGTTTISNCTITGNKATIFHGGGIKFSYDTSLTVNNSILWGNKRVDPSNGGLRDSEISPEYSDSISFNYSNIKRGWPKGEGNIGEDPVEHDPKFVTICDYDLCSDDDDCRDYDYYLQPDSPCIDKCPTGPEDDIRCVTRAQDGSSEPSAGEYDMGAYEYVP